jgi:predicted DNA-binding transcriptional regulator AlpA
MANYRADAQRVPPRDRVRRLVPTDEACTKLAVSESTLKRLVKEGILKPPVRISKRLTGFPEDELDAHIDRIIAERDAKHQVAAE